MGEDYLEDIHGCGRVIGYDGVIAKE